MKLKQLMVIGTALLSLWLAISVASAMNTVGAVYVMTNDAAGNEIVVFDRDANGKLTQVNSIPAEGNGFGDDVDPLGSQGSLVLSRDQRWLLAVNAGSDSISVFRVLADSNGLEFVDTFDSGGAFPVSLTIFHDLVYVLNADLNTDPPEMDANITGFYFTHTGELMPLPNSTRSLGAGEFSQVGFDPKGRNLIVTKRSDDTILVYAVDEDGLPGAAPMISPSSGAAPFGFVFDRRGHLLVSEAGSGAVTSYDILSDANLQAITSVPNGQTATCWIAANRGYAFTANTGSSTISSYEIKLGDGSLELVDATAGSGDLPIDLATTPGGRFLYVLNAGDGTVGMFRIKPDGDLVDMDTVYGGLGIFAQGIAVR